MCVLKSQILGQTSFKKSMFDVLKHNSFRQAMFEKNIMQHKICNT